MVLRRLRYTGGRRISQRDLAKVLGTSRAHLARLELHGSPRLTDQQLDRLEKAGDAIRPPFSRAEIDELRAAMQAVRADAIEQAAKAVEDITARPGQIFTALSTSPRTAGAVPELPPGNADPDLPDPFASSKRPEFLTDVPEIVKAAEDDIRHLARQHQGAQAPPPGPRPNVIITDFGLRNLAEEAEEPEKLRDAIREALRSGATVEFLIAPSAAQTSNDLVMLVPPMISYLGQQVQDQGEKQDQGPQDEQNGQRFQAHVIPEFEHPLAYGICVAGGRGLLFAHGAEGHAVGVRTNDSDDVNALRELLRPYWEGKKPIIEEVGRRTWETVRHRVFPPSVSRRIEHVLTTVELEEGPRRVAKEGLSILNIPVAIQAWKWRAAELCTAGWIPEDLRKILSAQAWELAAHGLGQLPRTVHDQYVRDDPGLSEALKALERYARGLQVRQATWGDQLSRHDFWDACPKTALTRFIRSGWLAPDEIPPSCDYVAERDDIEIIITRLVARLRSNHNYHLALIDDEEPFPQWLYLEVKANHVLAQVFDSQADGERAGEAEAAPGDNMLSVHIDCGPIATAFAGWFDEHVLKAAQDPPWHDNRKVANWLQEQLDKRDTDAQDHAS